MEFVFSFFPVLLFLLGLFLLDSFKLVRVSHLVLCISWGIAAALISYHLNTRLSKELALSFPVFSRYVAPITEEITKVAFILYMVSRSKIGFALDASIYGFAAGTGFALAENMVYLVRIGSETGILIWIMRGFGTAMMHGGCTALISILLIGGVQRGKSIIVSFLPGLLLGILIHSLFNHFLIHPYLQTALIFTILPLVFSLVFEKSNRVLQDWLEIEFSHEIQLLGMIQDGRFSDTKAGHFLISLKKHFSPEMILDLYCYLSLFLELSIKAKRNLMLKESGFPLIVEPDVLPKLRELQQIRKQIGKMGELAMQPLIRLKHRELWNLNQLDY